MCVWYTADLTPTQALEIILLKKEWKVLIWWFTRDFHTTKVFRCFNVNLCRQRSSSGRKINSLPDRMPVLRQRASLTV